MSNNRFACLTLVLAGLVAPRAWGNSEPARVREPVALAASGDGSRLFVANRRSGSVSVVDLLDRRVAFESFVAPRLVDLAGLPDGRLLALAGDDGTLVVLKVGERTIEVEARVAVTAEPSSLLVAPDGRDCVVASTALRQLTLVHRDPDPTTTTTRTVDLPFAPLRLAWAVPGSVVVAADAYGGAIGVVDLARGVVDSVRTIPGHNIRGLARSGDGRSLVVAHQTLSKLARSSFEDVHWGSFVGNQLRWIRVEALLEPGIDLLAGSRVIALGRSGRAAGDPGAIAVDQAGRLAIALSGVQEVALVDESRVDEPRRIAVGARPSAVLARGDGSSIYVADSLDDSISILDVASGSRSAVIALGPRPELGPVERGERLFFDARLSHDGWMSCQSCHTDGRDNGRVADTLTDGGYGAPKRVTPLLGVGSTAPWGWLGRTMTLEDQVRKSIETTMRGRPPSPEQVSDLTAYLRSLPPPKPRPTAEVEAAGRGLEVFRTRKCAGCHAPPAFTTEGRFDVGLVDEAGNREFNPPSLRGVGDRSPYLHDGRASRLQDVFLKERHPRRSGWSPGEVDDLVAYLKTL